MRFGMRFGVSARILSAYAVLLAAFAAMSAFTLVYLQQAQEHVDVHQSLSAISHAVDAAHQHLGVVRDNVRGEDEVVSAPSMRTVGLSRQNAHDEIQAAAERLRGFLAQPHPSIDSSVSALLLEARGRLGALEVRAAGLSERQGSSLQKEAEAIRRQLDLVQTPLRRGISGATADLQDEEWGARRRALALGAVGLLVAFASALVIWRTLQPLRVLRVRAREVAGGDYARRIGVRSRDEIGDLAREFDAMAEALQERERQLIRSERLATVGRVAAQITHEIRNPLASIGLNTELLADELPADSEEGRRLVAAIAAEVDRLSDITETYLRFVRLPKAKREPEEIGSLVGSVLEFARAELGQAGVTLSMQIEPALPEVLVDENQIRQVILNLVRNAREAMPDGGGLRVEVRRAPPSGVSIVVADSGPGIPAEDRARVFEPFFSTKERGTGLGLALVHQVVTEHGGQISVDAPEGGGSRFVIALPGAPVALEPQGAAAAAGPALARALSKEAGGPA